MNAQIVIPSEVEGPRHETFKVTQRDPSVRAGLAQFARDGWRAELCDAGLAGARPSRKIKQFPNKK